MTRLNLPEAIAAYFEADRRDGTAVAACFTEDGVVVDEGQTHTGHAAIKAWKTAATAQTSYTTEPTAFEMRGERFIVTGRVTGHFPGSPVSLRYTFLLDRDKIESLEITP